MHPYREMPVASDPDLGDESMHLAVAVLVATGVIAMIFLPVTKSGAFGALCAFAGVDWLVRHSWR